GAGDRGCIHRWMHEGYALHDEGNFCLFAMWMFSIDLACCETTQEHLQLLEAFLCDWSGRRGSNPRQPAWKAGTLPLSYSRTLSGCADLNRGPHGPKPCALPTALHPAERV